MRKVTYSVIIVILTKVNHKKIKTVETVKTIGIFPFSAGLIPLRIINMEIVNRFNGLQKKKIEFFSLIDRGQNHDKRNRNISSTRVTFQ